MLRGNYPYFGIPCHYLASLATTPRKNMSSLRKYLVTQNRMAHLYCCYGAVFCSIFLSTRSMFPYIRTITSHLEPPDLRSRAETTTFFILPVVDCMYINKFGCRNFVPCDPPPSSHPFIHPSIIMSVPAWQPPSHSPSVLPRRAPQPYSSSRSSAPPSSALPPPPPRTPTSRGKWPS